MISDQPGAIPQVTLEDGPAKVRVAPSRGGMVTSFATHGREWLFLDTATFEDRAKNVRGGVPVLFPTPGKLTGDAWSHAGKRGAMKQHGFARTHAWREVARTTKDGPGLSLQLDSDDATRAQFPWPFLVRLRYALEGEALRIDIGVENPGDAPLPFGFGFHPYFHVAQAEKASARIPTAATRAWDNVQKKEIPFSGIDLTAREVDLHLVDHGGTDASLELADRVIALRGSPEFTRWVVWTLEGRDFVCLEPWTCPGDALNTNQGLIELAPGARRDLWLELAVTPR